MLIGKDDFFSTLSQSCKFLEQHMVLKTFIDSDKSLINFDIYSSSFCIAMAQSQYLLVIGKDSGSSTLY